MANVAFQLPPLMTVDEFLAWPGDGNGTRYELVDGVPRAMAAAAPTHGIIHNNIAFVITQHLRSTRPGCVVVTAPGIRPRLRAEWNFRVPEIGVTCNAVGKADQMLIDPILLVEVLSPSNAQDTWSNIPLYASVPSVQEILIVHSTRVKVEILRRAADQSWPENPEVIIGLEAIARLTSIECDVPLAEFYRGSHWDGPGE